jgi:hypothetical protein
VNRKLTLVPIAVWLGVLTLPIPAADFYVDATSGSNVSGNGTKQSPWKTISFAVTGMPLPAPAAGHTLHVNPGYYDTQAGELFPIQVPLGVRLVGAGYAQSVIFGDGKAQVALLQFAAGADVRNELTGIGLHSGDPALLVSASTGPGTGPVIRNCRFSYNLSALRVLGPTTGARAPVVETSEFLSNTVGAVALVGSAGSCVGGRFDRCLFDDNRGVTLDLQGGAGTVCPVIQNCALVNNRGDGIRFQGGSGSKPLLTHVTVRGNAGAGLRVMAGSSAAGLRVRNSIFYGHVTDLASVPAPAVTHCCFLTVSGANAPRGGTNGNLQVDPLFWGKWDAFLSPFSPVIDRASFDQLLDPTQDMTGDRRDVDGDGDAVHAPDMGADEYMPLYDSGSPPMPGGFSVLVLDLPSHGANLYYLGLSLSNTGIPVPGKRSLPLFPDPLLALVLNGQFPFVDKFIGALNTVGFAQATINWPNLAALRGNTFYTAGITLQAGYPGGIRCVTNGIALMIR